MNLEIKLNRGFDSGRSTIGIISMEKKVFVSLEDTHRDEKIKGETCIPSGRYEVKFRKELSGLTQKYRDKYEWFKWHLWIQDVPMFEYVYIHIGNFPKNTDGCILVAETFDSSRDDMILNSAKAFREFYRVVSNALDNGRKVFITIKDA